MKNWFTASDARKTSLRSCTFVQKELDILGARNCLDEFPDVISFFERRRFDPQILISQAIDISEAPEALANWAAHPGQTSKIMVRLAP